MNHIPINIRQPEITALKPIRQFGVIDAHLIEDGGVQVMDLNGIFDHVITQLVGLAKRDTSLDTPAGQPHTESPRVVIAP